MRRVEVYKNPIKRNPGSNEIVERGFFHGISISHEEYESGPGHFSVAIIEDDEHRMMVVPVEKIRFIDPQPNRIDERNFTATEIMKANKLADQYAEKYDTV